MAGRIILNEKIYNGLTFLGLLISKNHDEWNNFVNRMRHKYPQNEADVNSLEFLQPGQLLVLNDPAIITEVRLWASYRFQPFARTVRGIAHQREALEHLAKIQFHDKRKLLNANDASTKLIESLERSMRRRYKKKSIRSFSSSHNISHMCYKSKETIMA